MTARLMGRLLLQCSCSDKSHSYEPESNDLFNSITLRQSMYAFYSN